MILYTAGKYFILVAVFTAGLAVLPIMFGKLPLRDAALSALFWAGFFAAGTLYWEFKRRGIWPLMDNLRLSRWLTLGLLIVGNLVLTAGMHAWLK